MQERPVLFSGGVQRTGPLQSGLTEMEWLSYQTGGRGLFPNISGVIVVPTGLPDDAVSAALDALLLRHEALRTTFDADDDGRPRQTVHEAVRVTLPEIEDESSRRLFVEMPFDVSSEPPIRFCRAAVNELVFVVAHIAVDATGAEILAADLTELLAAQADRRTADLRVAPPQPVDRALHERGAGRPRVESSLRYWCTNLPNIPATVLPVSRGKPGVHVVRSDLRSPAAGSALASLQRQLAASPTSIFIAAAFTALAIQFGRDRVGLGLTWSFRELPSTRGMVASVFRDMPLLVDFTGGPSFREALRQVQTAILVAGRNMSFDVLEFHENAGRAEADRGSYLPTAEAINCVFEGIDLALDETDSDPFERLAESQLLVDQSNTFSDVCNLYIGAYPVDGTLHICAYIDASVHGGPHGARLVELIETILVHASAFPDLTFAAAESLATEPWRPGPRWAKADGVWVDLDFLADRLRDHPGVRQVNLRTDDDRLVAYVSADLEAWELRDFLLSTDNGRQAVVSPHHFVVRRSDGLTVAGSGADRPALAPDGTAERVLRDAVAEVNRLEAVTMAGTYLGVGGRLHLAPRVLSSLLGAGFDGLDIADLRSPTSLRTLAGRLRRRR